MSDLLALASDDYGCCENGVDFATLLALIAGIALATYFLRLQIIILMRGKRSLHPTEVSISKVLQNLSKSWDEYQWYQSWRSLHPIEVSISNVLQNLAKAFCPKIQLWFPEKIVDLFVWKTRENVVVLDFLADNFDFTRKIVKKKELGEKLVKMLGFCQNWIFGQKLDFSNSGKLKKK